MARAAVPTSCLVGFSPEEQAAFASSLPGLWVEADGVLNLLFEREEPLRLQVAFEKGRENLSGVSLRRGGSSHA